MESKQPINLKIHTPPQWKGHGIVAYFQATIAGGYAQRVRIVNEERIFEEVTGETPGVSQGGYGKQFLNNKQSIGPDKYRTEYNFSVWIEHNKNEGSRWERSEMECESVKIKNNAAFGIVISDDGWPGDMDFDDCVVIISLYKGRE